MKITVLSENTAISENLASEHGLSLYIETENHKILFDTGQSDIFYKNATILGIDLSEVDIAVISHGHYDHGGGLKKFMEINSSAPIFISTYAFDSYFSQNGYIGLDASLKDNPRFVKVNDKYEIEDGLEIIPSGNIKLKFKVESYGLETLKDSIRVPDKFNHEQYLKITENDKTVIISGCSHKGILNIMNHFYPDVLIGGFHFMKIDPNTEKEKLKLISSWLSQYNTLYYTCHCTGLSQYHVIKSIMGMNLNYISTGSNIKI